MPNLKTKTIKILLEDGDLDGLIIMEDSSWKPGELYSISREKVEKLTKSDVCDKSGVYLLLSENMVYVGQSKRLKNRIEEHLLKKEWWERVIVLTTSDNSLKKEDIDFLEDKMIKKAEDSGNLDSDNIKKGNKSNVDRFRKPILEQYLEKAFFLMEMIGVSVFNTDSESKKGKSFIDSIPSNTKEEKEIRQRGEAKKFLEKQGINVSKHYNYASIYGETQHFWINPKVEQLEYQWDLILNDQNKSVIYYLSIPPNTFCVSRNGEKGLKVRNDRVHILDLNIDKNSLLEKRAKISFKKYVVKKIKYN